MEKVFRAVTAILDGIATLVSALVILGGASVGAFLGWLFLSGAGIGSALLWCGVLAAGCAGAFITWLAMHLLILLGGD